MVESEPERPERSGRIAHGLPTPASGRSRQERQEDSARVPTQPTPGRSLVTRRAVVDLVRSATLASYGVTGFAGRPLDRLLERLGLTHPGVAVHLGETLDIDLGVRVAYGVPVAEVARQVDSAVRYAVRRATALEVGRLTIHVGGVRFGLDSTPPVGHPAPEAIGPRDRGDSGTDVA